jgi:hypothetical protein
MDIDKSKSINGKPEMEIYKLEIYKWKAINGNL